MSYTPTNWQNGDTITAEKLNKIEGGIEGSADGGIYKADKIEMPGNTGTAGQGSIVLCDGHETDANLGYGIHIGSGYSSSRNHNFHLGAWALPSANLKGRYPWIADNVDSDGKLFAYTDGNGCLNVGANQIKNGGESGGLAIGVGNVITPGNSSYPNFVAGMYNFANGVLNFLFGMGLKGAGSTNMVFMCGQNADAEAEDRFVVGNGTVSGTTRTPKSCFRVTKDGDAIAYNSIGIRKSDGTTVSITAEQLEALLALLN